MLCPMIAAHDLKNKSRNPTSSVLEFGSGQPEANTDPPSKQKTKKTTQADKGMVEHHNGYHSTSSSGLR